METVLGLWASEHEFQAFAPKRIDFGTLQAELAKRSKRHELLGTSNYLPNPDPLLRRLSISNDIFFELVSDAHTWGTIQSRKSGTLRRKWYLNTEEASGVGVKETERWLRALNVRKLIRQGLNGSQFGMQPAEVMWWHTGHDFVPRDVVCKPYTWFSFNGKNELIYHSTQNLKGAKVPDRKFILFQHNETYENPYGESVLSKCFWPVQLKKGGMNLWVRYLEKFGIPYISAKYRRGTKKDERDTMFQVLEAMLHEGLVVAPNDWEIDMLTAAAQSGVEQLHRTMIEYCDRQITKAQLGHDGGAESTPGMLGNDDTAQIVRQEIVDADCAMIEDGMNDLIDLYYQINWGDAPRPRFEMYEADDVNMHLAERDTLLYAMGVEFNDDYFANTYSIKRTHFKIAAAKPQQGPMSIAPNGVQQSPQTGFPVQTIANPALPGQTVATGTLDARNGAPVRGFLTAPAQPIASFAQSAPNDNLSADQQAIDELFTGMSPEAIQVQMSKVLKPVMNFVNGNSTYAETFDELANVYPDMDTHLFEATIARAVWFADVIGRLSVQAEDGIIEDAEDEDNQSE